MRYVAAAFIESTFHRGKSLEQFLGGKIVDGDRRIRWAELRPTKSKHIEVWLYEVPDPGNALMDIYVLGSDLEAPDAPVATCETSADALKLAHALLGAAFDRWVNQGVTQSEFEDFVAAGRPDHWPPL